MSVISLSKAVSDSSVVKSAGADKDASAPLSSSFPFLPTIKDQRAYEHNRQRVKKAADVLKMRQQKRSGSPFFKLDRGTVSEKYRTLRADDIDPLDGVFVESAHRDETPPLPKSPEVKLSDLIVRKQDRKKEPDFEVIPHIRSVIVLDDFTPDLAADEPWEHIYGESDSESGEPVSKTPSYAQVLVSN
ncbi:uncharacterized protein EV420DRAFT_1636417 [Desarmillaria tabescens]|uniref:Uncharacterized protein n=1 Tax=Armillaria tabescens TaxID=1929756 RepID=A0AA39T5G2_ARMTA|nr:uncharacterized protein EV420DRAFT_1636417 [Desarmillaria tabescens]KAK0465866.1 hypothetical protein EV420DRAFT_1636417 [Desarmillaria tabescens]